MKKRLNLSAKIAIAFASVGAFAGAVVGFMKLYAVSTGGLGRQILQVNSSFDTRIPNRQVNRALLMNQFGKPVAEYDFKAKKGNNTPVTLLVDFGKYKEGQKISYIEFLDTFISLNNNNLPNLKLEVGPIVFSNNYINSVSPDEFIEFTNWFFTNVSWGPDLLTLKEFKLSRGIQQNGNSITLGLHSGTREKTTIEFFPDAFFGSLPIYNINAGAGNAYDSLARQLNQDGMILEELEKYHQKIPLMIASHNSHSFGGIKLVNALKEAKNTYWFNADKYFDLTKDPLNFAGLKGVKAKDRTLNYLFYAENEQQAKQKVQAYLNELQFVKGLIPKDKKFNPSIDVKADEIKKIEIKEFLELGGALPSFPGGSVDLESLGGNSGGQKTLLIDALVNNQKQKIKYHVFEDEFISRANKSNDSEFIQNDRSILASSLREIITKNFNNYISQKQNFRNVYDTDETFVGKSFYIYDANGNGKNPRFYKTKESLLQSELVNYDEKKVSLVTIDKTKVEGPNKLVLTTKDKKEIVLESPANNPKGYKYDTSFDDAFNTLKVAANYFDTFTPRLIKQGSKFINGKIVKTYTIFVDAYSGLLDKVLNKNRHLLQKINGIHTEVVQNKDGKNTYKVVNGEYEGIYATDRIPYLSLVAESDPAFKTTGINYLKYVSTHEYGHHQTLQDMKDISDSDESVVGGGIDSRSGVSDESYVNGQALQDYLNARSSGITFRKTDVNYQPTKTGSFLNFSLNNDPKNPIWETEKDIFGSATADDPKAFFNNKKRRFLQKFDELQEAAKLRNVKPYDLFIMNSFDHESATVNPSFSSEMKDPSRLKAEYFFYNNQENQNQKNDKFNFGSVVEQPGLLRYKGILKDGMGTPIEFDKKTGNPIIYKLKDSKKPITKDKVEILVKTKNNTPVIDLSTCLNKNGTVNLTKLKRQANQIINSINSLIVKNYYNGGWDESGNFETSMFNFQTYINHPLFTSTEKRKWAERITNAMFKHPDFNISKSLKLPEKTNSTSTSVPYYKKVLSQIIGQDVTNKDFNGFKRVLLDASYKTSKLLDNKTDEELKALDPELLEIKKYYNKQLDRWTVKDANVVAQTTMFNYFDSGIEGNNGYKYYVKPKDRELYRTILNTKTKESFESIIGIRPSYLTQNKITTYEQLFNNFMINLNQIGTIALVVNKSNGEGKPQKTLDQLTEKEIYPLMILTEAEAKAINFNYLKSNNGAFTTVILDGNNGQKFYTIKFKDIPSLIEFMSIDPSKYTIVENALSKNHENVRKWDYDYLKERYDVDKFFNEVVKKQEAYKDITLEQFKENLTGLLFDGFTESHDIFKFYKSKDFKATELDKYKQVFDGKLGLYGFRSFGNKFDKPASPYGEPIDRYNFAGNPQNVWKAKPNQKNVRTVDSIVKGIQVEIERKHRKNNTLNFGQLLQYAFGFTIYTDKPGGSIKDIYGQLGSFFGISQSSEIPNEDGTVVSWDYVAINKKRVQEKLNEIFGDYVFNIAEVLTRDYVQTVFVPSQQELDNLPNYLSGLSDFNTGNEYVFSGDNTKQWNERLIPVNNFLSADSNTIASNVVFATNDYEKIQSVLANQASNVYKKNQQLFDNYATKPEDLEENFAKVKNSLLSDNNFLTLSKTHDNDILNDLKSYSSLTRLSADANSYIGKTRLTNNGFFKDRWLRKIIDWQIYDDNRESVKDDHLNILELDNKTKVKDRARAMWLYMLRSKGIGDRTLAQIYRNKEKDSILMYGFIKKEYKDKVKKIAIKNKNNGHISYIDVHTNNTNNLFYLKRQSDISSKWTLEDEGYVSWTTDYAILSNFTNQLIGYDSVNAKGSEFELYFVDENLKEVMDLSDPSKPKSLMNLGSRKYVAENGKSYSISPVYARNENTPTQNRTIIRISNQFSV
ncbi:conserved hypothetical protein [Ureaplasma urealyticum serovar 2 str. ATCC 27814]|uniref:PDxFFG protein n=1 Tax=Ureaplasma urealyticum TaxID=2130 RepID=UPI0001794113|nr:PDxFFG protein [Ureaplasma urealyticum]EEH01978.1 conserved hypothetical protein [Ureaplasma urealyticum serovar 2 str. ATCC 27814]